MKNIESLDNLNSIKNSDYEVKHTMVGDTLILEEYIKKIRSLRSIVWWIMKRKKLWSLLILRRWKTANIFLIGLKPVV